MLKRLPAFDQVQGKGIVTVAIRSNRSPPEADFVQQPFMPGVKIRFFDKLSRQVRQIFVDQNPAKRLHCVVCFLKTPKFIGGSRSIGRIWHLGLRKVRSMLKANPFKTRGNGRLVKTVYSTRSTASSALPSCVPRCCFRECLRPDRLRPAPRRPAQDLPISTASQNDRSRWSRL